METYPLSLNYDNFIKFAKDKNLKKFTLKYSTKWDRFL